MNAAWAMPQPAVWHLTARDVEIKQQLNANQGRTLLDKYQEAKARIMLERKPIVSSFSCPLKLPTWIEMPYTDPVLHSNLQPHTTPSHKCGSCNQEGTFFIYLNLSGFLDVAGCSMDKAGLGWCVTSHSSCTERSPGTCLAFLNLCLLRCEMG